MTMSRFAFLAWSVVVLSALALTDSVVTAQNTVRKTESATINGKKVSIEHASLPAGGGEAIGTLVPYGQVWAIGDAVLTTEAPLKFDKCSIAPGSYNLFVVPSETPPWELIVSKRQGSSHVYDKGLEICRDKMAKSSSGLNSPPPQLTLMIIRISMSPVDLGFSLFVIQWVNARVDIMFSAG